MKNVNLKELNAQEMKQIDGGIWPLIGAVVAMYIAGTLYAHKNYH